MLSLPACLPWLNLALDMDFIIIGSCARLKPTLVNMDIGKDQLNLAMDMKVIITDLCARLKPRLVNMDIGKDQLNLDMDKVVITDLCGQLADIVGSARKA